MDNILNYKQLQFNKKSKTSNRKFGRRFEYNFLKEDVQIANNHMIRCQPY